MSSRNGDRSMFNRKRKQKIARRLKTDDLRTQIAESKSAASKPTASKAESKKKTAAK